MVPVIPESEANEKSSTECFSSYLNSNIFVNDEPLGKVPTHNIGLNNSLETGISLFRILLIDTNSFLISQHNFSKEFIKT